MVEMKGKKKMKKNQINWDLVIKRTFVTSVRDDGNERQEDNENE